MQSVARRLSMFLAGTILLPTLDPFPPHVQAQSPASCCPQSSVGWMLFEDLNPGVPDFWYEDTVTVESIIACSHGVHFVFTAMQNGERCSMALVVVNPTREFLQRRLQRRYAVQPLYGGRVSFIRDSRSMEAEFEAEFEQARYRHAQLVEWLSAVACQNLSVGVRIDFLNTPRSKRPRILPTQELAFRWNEEVFWIRGYLDVYVARIA